MTATIEAGRAARARHLLDLARSLARPEGDPVDLREGFDRYAAAVREMRDLLAAGDPAGDVRASGGSGAVSSPAREEVGAFYALAQRALDDPQAIQVIRTTAPIAAAGRLQAEAPGFAEALQGHLDRYAWVRVRGRRFDPAGPRELFDRLQAVVTRWPAEVVAGLAHPVDPDEALARLAGRPEVLVQAECMARPFLRRIGEALGCSLQQVLFSSPEELQAALAGEAPLSLAEIDARIGQPDAVDGLVVLSGLTGCRGRASGPVRVVLDASDLHRLEFGDVLVTAASTTDFAGGATVFPTRGGGPDALERALAVVTDEGGALSHGAIVCRERGIPCVLGVERATSDLAEGRVVDVDATRQLGQVFTLD